MTRQKRANGLDQRPEVPPPIPAFSWMGSLSPLFLVPTLALVAIALFAPDDVLDRWSMAKAFTNWMQLKMPFINRHANSTSFPEVALLVNCLTVAFTPVLSLVWLTQSFVNYPKLLARSRSVSRLPVRTHLFIIFCIIPFCLSVGYGLVALPGDPSWAKGFTTNHRGGLAFLSASMLYICSMGFGGWILMIRIFVDLHIRRDVK